MRRHQVTEGAAMIMVVLFTLLLLAGILAATLRLSLGSRQNTADQAATLKAQYAVESNLALVRSKLRDIQSLLSADNISIASNVAAATLKTDAENFCGNTNWNTVVQGSVTKSTCIASPSVTNTNRMSVARRLVKPTSYTVVLPPDESKSAGTLDWWNAQIGSVVSVGSGDNTASYTIQPQKVEIYNNSKLRFYMKVVDINLTGKSGTAERRLSGTPIEGSEWWFEANLPPFLDNVLFTNRHRSKGSNTPDVGFDIQAFDGPVHTNEKFLFYSGATASFTKKVTSAGCTNLSTIAAGSSTCTSTPGAYRGSSNSLSTGTNAQIKTAIDNYTDVTWNNMDTGQPNFAAAYRPMPTTSETQKSDAQSRGLYISDAVIGIELKAAGEGGSKPSTYNTSTQKWSPAPTYQYITVTNSDGTKTEYRYSEDRKLYKKVGESFSSLVKENFNGVIYADGQVGYTNTSGKKAGGLTGPGRDSNENPYPALAPFAQMTISGSSNIYLGGDLAMSETPRSCADSDQACKTDNNTRKNVLGIYTQSGDVVITQSAPYGINLHAMIMSSSGEVTVDNYTGSTYRGYAHLIGGLVENYYGGFGYNLTTSRPKGYARDFKYDRRFQDIPGFTPPSYPVSPVWQSEDARSEDGSRKALKQLPLRLDNFIWQQSKRNS